LNFELLVVRGGTIDSILCVTIGIRMFKNTSKKTAQILIKLSLTA
jgi:hypothetical protein